MRNFMCFCEELESVFRALKPPSSMANTQNFVSDSKGSQYRMKVSVVMAEREAKEDKGNDEIGGRYDKPEPREVHEVLMF